MAPYDDRVEPTTRPLPEHDLLALFAVLLSVHAPLYSGELPDVVFDRLAERLADDGLIPQGASRGEVNALLADLAQRVHWAMDPASDQPYPRPAPGRTTHDLLFPTGEQAARAFVADVTALGGRDVWAREGQSRWTTGPDGKQQPIDPPQTWLVDVTFGELPPDPAFVAREDQLTALAAHHGGAYTGSHG